MSQRTIAEFNHDYGHRIEEDPYAFAHFVLSALRSGGKDEWERLEYYGLRRTIQAHHSDERKVVVNKREYPIP